MLSLFSILQIYSHHVTQTGEQAALDRLEERLESLLGLPRTHAYQSQLLRYVPEAADAGTRTGRKSEYGPAVGGYGTHTDCTHLLSTDDRVFTSLVYVSTVGGGSNRSSTTRSGAVSGATVFPRLGLSVPPRCGRALLFRSTDTGHFCDARLEHAAAPVVDARRNASTSGVDTQEGSKLVVQKWFSLRALRARAEVGSDGGTGDGSGGGIPGDIFRGTGQGQGQGALSRAAGTGRAYVLCDSSRSCRSYLPFDNDDSDKW